MNKKRAASSNRSIKEVLINATRQLSGRSESPSLDADLLISTALKKPKVWLYTNLQKRISSSQTKAVEKLIARRKCHEPMAYILGKADFYNITLEVNDSVLIPRPETEMLVELAINRVKNMARVDENSNTVLVDIGTGSGCIITALQSKLPKQNRLTFIGTDISARALRTAKRNLRTHGFLKNTRLIKGNLFDREVQKAIPGKKPFLIITANLPYVAPKEYPSLKRSVRAYEPRIALVAKNRGTALMKELIAQVHAWSHQFKCRFELIMEMDPGQQKALADCLMTKFPTLKFSFLKDLSKRVRVLLIKN